MQVLSFLSVSSGVGRSLLAAHLATTFALSGKRVLVVDMGHNPTVTSTFLGCEQALALAEGQTIVPVLAGERPDPRELIRPTWQEGVEIIPNAMAGGVHHHRRHREVEPGSRGAIRDMIEILRGSETHDLILIDGPSLFLNCGFAALMASDFVVSPTLANTPYIPGLDRLRDDLKAARGLGWPGHFLGHVLSRIPRWAGYPQRHEAALRLEHGEEILKSTIPDLEVFRRAIYERRPVARLDRKGDGARALAALADEIQERMAAIERSTAQAVA